MAKTKPAQEPPTEVAEIPAVMPVAVETAAPKSELKGLALFKDRYADTKLGAGEILKLVWKQPEAAEWLIGSPMGVLAWPDGQLAKFSKEEATEINAHLLRLRPRDKTIIQPATT